MFSLPKNSEIERYSCNSVYLRSAVDNKVNLMLFKNERIMELSSTLDGFEQRLVEMINGYVQGLGCNVFNQMNRNSRKDFINAMRTSS